MELPRNQKKPLGRNNSLRRYDESSNRNNSGYKEQHPVRNSDQMDIVSTSNRHRFDQPFITAACSAGLKKGVNHRPRRHHPRLRRSRRSRCRSRSPRRRAGGRTAGPVWIRKRPGPAEQGAGRGCDPGMRVSYHSSPPPPQLSLRAPPAHRAKERPARST